MINVLIVDDYKLIRDAYKRTLMDEADMNVSGEAENAIEAFDLLKDTQTDIVLMDIIMPGLNGIDALKIIKVQHPTVPVLMVSALSEVIYVKKSIEAGAAGFVNKENAYEELIIAIRKVVAGDIFISTDFQNN